MKKRRLFLSALLCLTMLLNGMTVFAYTGNPDAVYCDICAGKVVLVTNSYTLSNGQSTHRVAIPNIVDKDGNPVYYNETCTVTYAETRIGKTCPTHGVRFDGICCDETHFYEGCPNYGLSRYYK